MESYLYDIFFKLIFNKNKNKPQWAFMFILFSYFKNKKFLSCIYKNIILFFFQIFDFICYTNNEKILYINRNIDDRNNK